MPESPEFQSQPEQIIAAVYQLLKRAEDRLNVTKEYVKWHALNHSIAYMHQEILDFNDFKEKINSDSTSQLTDAQKNIFVVSRAFCLLALINRILENYDASLQLADKALGINSTEAKAYIEIAAFHLRNRDYDRTIVTSTQAINLNPRNLVGYWIQRSWLLWKKRLSSSTY